MAGFKHLFGGSGLRKQEGSSDPLEILVLSSWAPPTIGGPQYLYNLFSNFRDDSYVILTSARSIDHGSGTTGTWLRGKYVFYDSKDGWKPDTVVSGAPAGRRPFPERVARFLEKVPLIGLPALEILGLLRSVKAFVVSALRIPRSANVKLLLGFSDWGPALLGTYIVHALTKIPYAVFYFDLYSGNLLPPVQRLLARVFEPILLKHASAVILTNEETGKYLRRRHGGELRYEIVPNSVFPEEYNRFLTPFDPTPPYTILFTGSAYWPQEAPLLNIIRAMDRLRDIPVRLDLHMPNVPDTIRKAVTGKPNIRLTSTLKPQSEMHRMQCGATLLFLPLAWNTKAPDIIATASPGKLTDYLASGRPMLVHAPDYSFVSRYAKDHGTGIVVDKDDVDALAGAIRRFCQEPLSGRQYVEKALGISAERHDARRNAAKLWDILTEAAAR